MPRSQTDIAVFIGSAIAAGCGLWLGAQIRLGQPPTAGPEAAADTFISWAAPSADAAEPAFDVSPPLLVKADGQWVTPEAREAAIAEQLAQADTAAQATADQTAVDRAIAEAAPAPVPAPPETNAAITPVATEKPPAPAIPPPIQLSALTP